MIRSDRHLSPHTSHSFVRQVGEGDEKQKIEYRVWNPFRSKLAAGILAGIGEIHMKPGCKLLYLGAASGTTVSHCSDIVGPEGIVYAVEFSHRSGDPSLGIGTPFSARCCAAAGRDLLNMCKQRPNVIPIIEDARHPLKYRMLVPMVDVIFADVAQPDQATQIVCCCLLLVTLYAKLLTPSTDCSELRFLDFTVLPRGIVAPSRSMSFVRSPESSFVRQKDR